MRRFAVALVVVSLGALSQPSPYLAATATPMAAYEAELLIYLLPDSHACREQGHQIGFHAEKGEDTAHFYYFFVFNATRQNPGGSVTIGYYAVNKWTATVWLTVPLMKIESNEISGVQAILRKGHGITAEILRKYESLKPGPE